MAPPGTQIFVHEKPTVRGTWEAHEVKGWYLRPSMEHYRCQRVYINKTIGERDSDCVDFFPHNTPLPYNSSSENVIVAAHKLDHALQNPAPQAPFSNIGESQMVVIEQVSVILPKVTYHLHQPVDPQQKQSVTKSAPILNKVRPTRDKHIPAEQHTIIEDDDGNSPTYFQRKFHISSSGPHITLLDIPFPPPSVRPAQPPRMETGGKSSNLRSSCKKKSCPKLFIGSTIPASYRG